MSIIISLLTILTTFAVLMVLVNYILRYFFENRYLDSKSEYLISNPLVQFLMMMAFGYWISQIFQNTTPGEDAYDLMNYLFEEKKAITVIFMLLASLGSIVVTITSAMSLFHIFKRDGNATLLKNLSYIGIALIGLTSLLGLIIFSSIKGQEALPIITFLLIAGIACWFEYKYCQSIDVFFMNGRELSYQEKIIALLKGANTQTDDSSEAQLAEKPKKYCPNCGEQIDATSKVCPICSEETNF